MGKNESNKNSLSNYEHDLKNSNFILCPQGNGIDTHKFGNHYILERYQLLKT